METNTVERDGIGRDFVGCLFSFFFYLFGSLEHFNTFYIYTIFYYILYIFLTIYLGGGSCCIQYRVTEEIVCRRQRVGDIRNTYIDRFVYLIRTFISPTNK